MSGVDVLVVGAGPAGWAAAAACAREELQVRLLAPRPHAPWHQAYGAWVDELSVVAAADVTRQQWDTVRVRTVGPGFRTLPRTYCLIDNELLRASLGTKAATTTVMTGRARSVEGAGDHLCVHTTDGAQLRARAVIDATGHPAAFGAPAPSPPAYQTAYGLVARLSAPPIPTGTMCLMDFDSTPFEEVEPATFLYAMDLGAGRWFVEETALAARPAVPLRTLRQRLEQRLAHRGVRCTEVIAKERCAFAMDAPLPRVGAAVAFGAAAAMVHPATGYQVAEALRRAPALAASLRQALDDHRDPSDIARAAHRAVWPAEALRQDTLYRLGLEVLLGLDAPATRAFFDGFFALPLDDWRGYVSRTSSTLALQRTMLRLIRRVPQHLRRRVLRIAMSPGALRTLSGVVAPTRLTR
ncbi:MAG: lycopene cyclase family protein [Actinobacteria bacterium]|nr:lycopene cyclase family protein [Actinomycetota bacterium]